MGGIAYVQKHEYEAMKAEGQHQLPCKTVQRMARAALAAVKDKP